MASVYKRNGRETLYVSFIDPETGKVKTKSTGLKDTKENRKKAEALAKDIKKILLQKKEVYQINNIQRATIAEAFKHFLIMNSDKTTKTIGDYERFKRLFEKTFDFNSPCTVLDKMSSEKWIMEIKKLNKQKNTIYNYYKVFNKFINFLFEYSYIPVFKINRAIKPKPEIKRIIVFTEEDVNKIMEELEKKNSNFTAVIKTLLYTGLRPSDILEIEVEDINLEVSVINYYSPKTKEHLTVPLHEELIKVLAERIKEVKSGRIFNYATIGEIGKAFRRFLEAIKLNKKGYNLRTFRKNFATTAYENDVSLMTTARLLRHKNISTTMKYYTAASKNKLAADLNKMKFTKGESK